MQHYRPPLDAEEIARRREADRQAKACNRIEGIPHDPATDPIFEALIVGEIDCDEAIARIKALPSHA
jgi:Antitoxin VbhA